MTEGIENARMLFAASICDWEMVKVYAVFDGKRLVITHLVPLDGVSTASAVESLMAEAQQRRSKGWLCLLDGLPGGSVPYAMVFDFDGADLAVAIERYFSMLERGEVVVSSACQLYLPKRGDYPQGFGRRQRALLLCVAGVMIDLDSEQHLNSLIESRLSSSDQRDVMRRLFLKWPERFGG